MVRKFLLVTYQENEVLKVEISLLCVHRNFFSYAKFI
jgi:hypothetical protein